MPTSNSEARKRASAKKPVENVKTTEALNTNPTPVTVEYADRFEPMVTRGYSRASMADAYWEGWDAALMKFGEYILGKGNNPYE